jgi:hypothetical protein
VCSIHCSHGNVTVRFIFIVVGAAAALRWIKMLIVAMEVSHGFPLHCCRAIQYVVLQLTITSIKYSVCVFVFLPKLCCMQSHLFCAVLHYQMWPRRLYRVFIHYNINGTIFGKHLLDIKRCVLIFSTTSVCNIARYKKNSARYYNVGTRVFT